MSTAPAGQRRLWTPGVRAMALGAVAFSVMSALVKVLGTRLPSSEIVLGRSVISLLMSAWAMQEAGLAWRGNRTGLLILRGTIGLGALVCYFYSVTHLPLADATIIHFANPVFTAMLAALFLGERLTWIRGACILLGLSGTVLVVRPEALFGHHAAPLDSTAVAVAFTGAALSAFAYVTVRHLRATDDPTVVVFYFALVATIGSGIASARVLVWPTPYEWVLLIGMGVTGQIGQICITRGLHLEPAAKATAIGYLQVVLAYMMGVAFFAELPSALAGLGSLLVLASVAWIAKTSET